MAESIKSAHTDRNGVVYLLVEHNPSWWTIKSADKIANNGQAHRLLAAGDQRYVTSKWADFIQNDRTQTSVRRPEVGRYSLR